MVRTKEPTLYDADKNLSGILYFGITGGDLFTESTFLTKREGITIREFTIGVFLRSTKIVNEEEIHTYTLIKEKECIYKQTTLGNIFGERNFNEIQGDLNQLLIDQIHWVNTHEWTGQEIQKNPGFYGITNDNLEIVS